MALSGPCSCSFKQQSYDKLYLSQVKFYLDFDLHLFYFFHTNCFVTATGAVTPQRKMSVKYRNLPLAISNKLPEYVAPMYLEVGRLRNLNHH